MERVKPEEKLARYVLNKRYIRYSNGTVKYSAFLPAPNGETSVFRISDLAEEEIWEIGNREVAQKMNKELLGRADILTLHVLQNELEVHADNNPPRHANIVGWPDAEEKSKQLLIAKKLEEHAQLHLT